VKPLLLPATAGVQTAIGVGPESTVSQVEAVKLFIALALSTLHAAIGVGPEVTVLQFVAVNVLVLSASTGVQDAIGVGPDVMGVGQVILPGRRLCAVQPTTGRLA
jgi:hypothetical protein